MRIAVISDIHANIIALEAVYKHIQSQKPDLVYCLGDLVNQNVYNNEVVDFIRANNIACVQGNNDAGIGNNQRKFSFAFGSREEYEWGLEAIAVSLQQTTEENKLFLSGLHLKTELSCRLNGRDITVLFTHGMPEDNTRRIYHFLPAASVKDILDASNADILFTGNTHWPSHHRISYHKDGDTIYKQVINPGSVGSPKDGYWKAAYLMVDIQEDHTVHDERDAIQVHLYRIDYDLDKAIKSIQHSKVPLHYAARLLQ